MIRVTLVLSAVPPASLPVSSQVQSQVNGGGGGVPGFSRPSWASHAALRVCALRVCVAVVSLVLPPSVLTLAL